MVLKERNKISTADVFDNKLLPHLFGTVWHTLITEEIWNILKDAHNPVIDFKALYRLTIQKVKNVLEVGE